MKPTEYKKRLEEISEQAGIHADKMEKKEYTNRAEFQRDLAITLELWQRRMDLFSEALQDGDIFELIDYVSPFGV